MGMHNLNNYNEIYIYLYIMQSDHMKTRPGRGMVAVYIYK